jgi:hypothetical protein
MSTTTTSTPMLSLSEFARLVSERHYHFLSQSLRDLEHQVKRHRAEQHTMELNIMNFRHQTARRSRFHPYGRTPSRIPPSTDHHDPPSNPSSHDETQAARRCECHASVDVSSTRTGEDQTRRRPFNDPPPSPSNETTDIGSRESPIYVFDDVEIYCEGCGEEGHFIGDCDREYRFDGKQYVPVPEGMSPMMEPTFVVDKDYYQRNYPRLQANGGKSTTLISHY